MSNIHLDHLEDEAIYIIREAAAEFERPIMLYSVGKDFFCFDASFSKGFLSSKTNNKTNAYQYWVEIQRND